MSSKELYKFLKFLSESFFRVSENVSSSNFPKKSKDEEFGKRLISF